jgi:acyl-CoA thioesterase
MHEFDQHSQLVPLGDFRYGVDLSGLWNVGPVPNGGYLIALAGKAMAAACSHQDPLTITGHYLRPAQPGPGELVVTPIKQGGTFDNAQVSLVQEGSERCRFIAAYGSLGQISGPNWRGGEPPVMPPPEACEPLPGTVVLNGRYESRFDPASLAWLRGERADDAEFRVWIRHADGRANDAWSILLFADALPPPVFNRFGPSGWVPTVELTVHLRAIPAPGFVKCCFRTRFVTNGLLEADGELWDAKGQLVALSRQLARLRQ